MADSIKINKLEIENVKRIKAVKIEPTKNGLTIVGGNNNQGKTSVLDSIAWALGGDRYKPSNATRDGSTIEETQLGVLSVVDNVQGEIDRIQQEENQKAEYMVLGRNENSILEMITIIKEYAERNGEEPVDVFNKILGEGVNGNEE